MKPQQRNNLSAVVIVLLALSWIVVQQKFKTWTTPQGVISSDVVFYYEYLPAFFIYDDVALKFKNDENFPLRDRFWAHKIGADSYVIKMSMGLSMLYLPFFAIAHVYCRTVGLPTDGFSDPYEIAMLISSLFYSIAGFFFLRKILLRYFKDVVVALCLLIIGWGTNLFNYTTLEACMSHAYLFCLFNIFFWYVHKWYQQQNLKNTFVIGFVGGMIALVRPTNILIFLIFFLFQVIHVNDFKNRILLFWQKKSYLIIIVFLFLLVWSPQLVYWKYNTGSWFFFSYLGERFFFTHPHFIEGFFGYRKGWLLYTPLMTLGLVGFLVMRKKVPEFFFGALLFFLLISYLTLSWWNWWYGGSFGLRAFIDMYGLLALPMGSLVAYIFEKERWKKIVFTGLIFILINFNLFQCYQYYTGSIHWDSMTKEAYWASFLKSYPPPGWHYLLKEPDFEKARNYGKEN